MFVIMLQLVRAIAAQEQFSAARDYPLPNVNEVKTTSLGIRKIAARHLTLYTDLPSSGSIDELPRVFDAAVPYWCEYFGVRPEAMKTWRIVGCLIRDKNRFVEAGLLPLDLPPFLNGYQRGSQLWWYEQPSDYYRRHLMLHEGTHAFMHGKLGGAGPPWYMEGTAELLATHRWQNNQLTLRYVPRDKTEVPEWGRIKIVRDAYRAGQPKRLLEIMSYDERAHLHVNPYGWCWAASAFFDGNPRYEKRFRDLQKYVHDSSSTFSERFAEALRKDETLLAREWQLFVSQLDYGYDIAREAIESKTVRDFARGEARIALAVDRGWQSSGLQLVLGRKYRLTASGRYQLADQPKTWWCEPNGVTIEYHRGQPLGIVMAAIVDETTADETTNGLLSPLAIGLDAEVTPTYAGTLYLRVNDHPAKLADNRGEVTVRISNSN